MVTDAWVRLLRSPRLGLGVTRCRELAAQDAEALAARFQEHHASGAPPLLPSVPGLEEVEGWVAACRADELDEMMLAVVGGDEAVLEALELVHVATPKDVALWASVPQALLDTLRRDLPPGRWAAVEGRVSAEAIAEWAARAQGMVDAVPWVELWASE